MWKKLELAIYIENGWAYNHDACKRLGLGLGFSQIARDFKLVCLLPIKTYPGLSFL